MLRLGFEADKKALMSLYNECFPDEPQFCYWFFENIWRAEDTLLIDDGKNIVSMAQMLKTQLIFDGRVFNACYIYAVATTKDARGKGYMAQIMEKSVEYCKKRGQQFLVLITQNDRLFKFYEQFGYSSIITVATTAVKLCALPENTVARTAKPTDAKEMLAIYNAKSKGILALRRSADDFKLQSEIYGENAIVLERSGHVIAYAFCADGIAVEACGEQCERLAGWFGAKLMQTLPSKENKRPFGCIKPIDEEARAIMGAAQAIYINLLYN